MRHLGFRFAGEPIGKMWIILPQQPFRLYGVHANGEVMLDENDKKIHEGWDVRRPASRTLQKEFKNMIDMRISSRFFGLPRWFESQFSRLSEKTCAGFL